MAAMRWMWIVLLAACGDDANALDAGGPPRDSAIARDAGGVCACDAGGIDARRPDFDAGPLPAGDSVYSLRFFGNGGTYDDRVRIALDDPETSAPGPAVDVGATDFTIEFWMKARREDNANEPGCGPGAGWTESNIIVDRDRHSQMPVYGVGIGRGAIVFAVGTMEEGLHTLCGSVEVTDDRWHHVAVTRRSSDGLMSIYVDGARDVTFDGPRGDVSYPDDGVPMSLCPGGLCDYSDPYLVFGAEKHGYGGISYSGLLDEVRISRTLVYGGAAYPVPSGPFTADTTTVGLYRFEEGAGTTASDASATGAHGELRVGGDPSGPEWSTDTPF